MKNYIPSRPRHLGFVNAVLLVTLTVLLGSGVCGANAQTAERAPGVFEDSSPPQQPKTPVSGSLGATVYKHMCVFCHGEDGNGGGKAMAYLYPWPRDFRKGVFKHRSTPTGSLPLDEDIYQTIMRGVPGTSMPAWKGALTEEEAWSVVEYVKGFSTRFLQEKPKAAIVVEVLSETTDASLAIGQGLYEEMRCSRCHGTDLKGDGSIADQL